MNLPSKNQLFRVFVIGPMNVDGEGKLGVLKSDHISNILEALNSISSELSNEFQVDIESNAPDPKKEDYNEIADFAFSNLDRCDFAIADISERSPSVMYELAILHALGKPFITIDFSPFEQARSIYYLNDTRVRPIEDFTIEILCDEIFSALRSYLSNSDGLAEQNFRANKLSKYYLNVPLVDASAVAGVAAGYVHNLLRHAIADCGPIARNLDLSTLVIIRPNGIRDANESWARLKEQLKPNGLIEDVMLDCPTHVAGKLRFAVYNEYVIDYPTAIESLIHSPSYIRFNQTRRSSDSELAEFELQLIDAFFRNIISLIRVSTGTSIIEKYMRILSIEEALEL